MEETRTIHELLIILRDNAKVTKSWFGLKQRIYCGLCWEISELYENGVINIYEFYLLKPYLRENKPIDNDYYPYYWSMGEWKPRLKWLNEHIELTK